MLSAILQIYIPDRFGTYTQDPVLSRLDDISHAMSQTLDYLKGLGLMLISLFVLALTKFKK